MAGRRSTTPAARFAEKCAPPDERGCILWTGGTSAKGEKGYGLFYADGSMRSAHRWAYEQVHGPLPPHLDACHSCDVRRCVNVAHLFPGTRKANMEDAVRKGRMDRTHKPKGEAHGRATLNWDLVREMRALHGEGASLTWLSGQFDTSVANAHRIINNQLWKEDRT
jgi:hypothetical protein